MTAAAVIEAVTKAAITTSIATKQQREAKEAITKTATTTLIATIILFIFDNK